MNNLQHEIVQFAPATGSISVRYYCDEVPDGLIYNVDLPIENGQYVSAEIITEHILQNAPIAQLQRLAVLQSMQTPEHILQMTGNVITATPDSAATARYVRNMMLADCDWTQLADAPLSSIAKAAYHTYRQELRDLPLQEGFPENIVWPRDPNSEPR